MTNNTNVVEFENLRTIKLLDFDTLVDLGNEEDAIAELCEYSDSMYIGDVIAEIADSYIPIYTNDVWENASTISEYIEDAISQGLANMESGIVSVLQSGYYNYYTQVLYENLESFKFNYVATALNEYIKAHELELDIEELESHIETEVENMDNDNRLSDVTDLIQQIVETINDGEFNL